MHKSKGNVRKRRKVSFKREYPILCVYKLIRSHVDRRARIKDMVIHYSLPIDWKKRIFEKREMDEHTAHTIFRHLNPEMSTKENAQFRADHVVNKQ